MPTPSRLRTSLKTLLARLGRPALLPLTARVEELAARLETHAATAAAGREEEARRHAALVARFEPVEKALEILASQAVRRGKHTQELAFWRWLAKTPEGRASVGGDPAAAFGRWQRQRLRELGEAMGFSGEGGDLDAALDAWCAGVSAVEVGSGPYPALAAAPRWRRAVAVDPLASAYAEEGLAPESAGHVTMLESPGERIPLPAGSADLVVIENALDHVSDPGAVLAECHRLLREGGLLWLLVDLSDHVDAMHPHPFDEARARSLVRRGGFEIVHDRTSAHKSHPEAYGEYRGLARKVGALGARLGRAAGAGSGLDAVATGGGV